MVCHHIIDISYESKPNREYTSGYNPPINFRATLLAISRHVVQIQWIVITQYPHLRLYLFFD